MDLNEIIIKINNKDIEQAEAVAAMASPYGFYTEDYSDIEIEAQNIAHIDLIDDELLKKDKSAAYIHVYTLKDEPTCDIIDYIKERFSALKIDYLITEKEKPESEYKDKWKEYFKITPVGKNFLICPEWEKTEKSDKIVLKIDPGAAFGTGKHETTSSCMELLEKYVKSGMNVLDIGCGSGILSVCSALLGCNKATGFDIDETAITVARHTAQLNNVDNICEFYVGDATKSIKGTYDIVVANIVADVIIGLSDKIKPLLNKGGKFIFSGIIEGRENEVYKALTAAGLKITDTIHKDNWFTFGGYYDRV